MGNIGYYFSLQYSINMSACKWNHQIAPSCKNSKGTAAHCESRDDNVFLLWSCSDALHAVFQQVASKCGAPSGPHTAGHSWSLFNPKPVGFFSAVRLGQGYIMTSYTIKHTVFVFDCNLTGRVLWISECFCRMFTTQDFWEFLRSSSSRRPRITEPNCPERYF